MISHRVEARVRAEFEAGSVEQVLARLRELNVPDVGTDTGGRERVQAAVVLLAAGSWSAFEQSVALAEVDWRDVLVSAGLANEGWRQQLDARLGHGHAT